MRFLSLLFVFFISACGGGRGSEPITSLTASNFRYGQLATLTLVGNQLDHNIQLIADPNKCIGLSLSPATSSNTRTATCLITGTGSVFFTVKSSASYVLYTTSLEVPEPVTDIQTSELGFGSVTLTLVGDPQNSAIKVSSDKCINMTLSPVSSNAVRTANCALIGTGPVQFKVTNLTGTSTLYSKTLTAPAPSAFTAWNPKYGQKAYFAFPSGGVSNLQLAGSGCENLTMDNTASTADTRIASCTLRQTGELRFDMVDPSNNVVVQSTSLNVPQPQVTLTTNLGDIVMELNPTAAPITVNNFLSYVNQSPSFYVGTIFHRVIPGFVVQGGGITSGATMAAKTGLSPPIALESNKGLNNVRASVAMARGTAPDSATSQFFFNLVNNTSLNYSNANSPGYAVFGRVVSGMDIVDLIATQTTRTVSAQANVPVTDIVVTTSVQTQ
jgi:peptidyl-prolyl cis-trans isomerase A (cyclophilin A)